MQQEPKTSGSPALDEQRGKKREETEEGQPPQESNAGVDGARKTLNPKQALRTERQARGSDDKPRRHSPL